MRRHWDLSPRKRATLEKLAEEIRRERPPAALPPERVLARHLAQTGVRNTCLDELHAGTAPSSKSGDYSDVRVVTPYGEIPWCSLSRISDEEMRTLMLQVEERLRAGLEQIEAFRRQGLLDELLVVLTDALFGPQGVTWDIPEAAWQRRVEAAAQWRQQRASPDEIEDETDEER